MDSEKTNLCPPFVGAFSDGLCVVIVVSFDIRTNVWLLVMLLNTGSDGVSLYGLVLGIGHG